VAGADKAAQKIVCSLLLVLIGTILTFSHSQKTFNKKDTIADTQIRKNVFYHYNVTLRIFNETMDLCLPEPDVNGIEVHDSRLFDGL
jgi:hypothetical protein